MLRYLKMLGYLREWYVWVVIIIVIVIILLVYTKLFRKDESNKKNIESNDYDSEAYDDHSRRYNHQRRRNYNKYSDTRDINVPTRRVKPSTERRGNIYSSRTAIVNTQSIPDIDEEIDLTPELNQDLWDRPESTKHAQSKGEAECQRVIEEIYGVPFQVQVRPKWLINPKTGRCLELDLYNEKLKIAVEYNGEQHYKYTPRFQRSYQDFKNQVERDNIKIDICDRHGIYLITVPYNVPHPKIGAYIRYWLPEAVRARQERNFESHH